MEVGVLVTATAQSGDLAEVARRVKAEGAVETAAGNG